MLSHIDMPCVVPPFHIQSSGFQAYGANMALDLSDFLDEFDELSSQVSRARSDDFARLLRRWFSAMEEAGPPVSSRIAYLMSLYPFERVEQEVMRPESGIGSGTLDWPEGREERLGAQLNLFRHMADEKVQGWNFAHDYFSARSNNINDILHEMTDQLFDVHTAELRRHLVRNADTPLPNLVPAAGRLVPINHNSAAYTEVLASFTSLSEEVAASNSIEPEIKQSIVAEMSAAREILLAPVARFSVIEIVVVGPLLWMASEFASAAFAPAIAATLGLLKFLFPELPY